MSAYGGEARWNDETQSWEPVTAPRRDAGAEGPPQPEPLRFQPPQPFPELPALPAQPPPPMPPPQFPVYDPVAPPFPPPAPPTGPGSGRGRRAVMAGVVAAAVAVGFGGWLLWGRDGGTDTRTEDPPPVTTTATQDAPSATGTPSGEVSPSSEATPSDGTLPPGFRTVQDPAGFSVAVPEDWNRTSSEQGVFYNSPDGKSLVQIFTLGEPDTTPLESLRGTSRTLSAKPGYQEISLGPAGEGDAAELVYAYDRQEGRRKVVDRAFTGADGRQHAILVAGPETDWPRQRETLTTALASFKP
ncbi:hypothetical protein [Streptomyces sp. NPDC048659]|uniref:hypothetical protein n=1 Tax=Streptomyces sp. NPDC048659 TaxID=3155489 RepID=UPI00342C397B